MSSLGAISSTVLPYAACGPNCQCASCLSLKSQAANSAVNSGKIDGSNTGQPTASNGAALTKEQIAEVQQLAARDLEVRQHEQAHLAAAGGLASSGASYKMQKGPDGKSYAVGGEVSIDVSPGKSPEETLRKARVIQAAALAPAEPSGQDRSVAAAAQAMELQAQLEIAQRSPQQQKLAENYASNEVPRSGFNETA